MFSMEASFKDKLNQFIKENVSPETQEKFKTFFKFNAPVVTPTTNAAPPIVPPVAAPIKTKDGTEIKYDTPTPVVNKTKVTVVTPDGELPAPDGEIVLEDGTNLTIVGGVITEIESPQTEQTEPMDPAMNANAMAEMNTKVSGLENQLAQANKIISALTSRFEAQEKESTEIKNTLTQFSKDWSEFMGAPLAKPIVTPTVTKLSKKDNLLNKFHKNN